ncbi:MAG: hypothetical protein H6573_34765 [Lewinellaceae bacterium]|nr:hypothetical protein [Lewinellaceae bacterium]
MRTATILMITLLLATSCMQRQTEQQDSIEEVLMFDELGNEVGTALVPLSLTEAYSHIEFYDGVAPQPGTDFDIVSIPMQDGNEVYLLCIR